MNLDTSAQTQNLQSSIKAADLESFLHLEFTRSDKTWSDKPTSAHTTSFAEGLLQVEYERSQKKSVKRVGQKTFHVEMMDADNNTSASEVPPYDVDDMDDFQHVPIPLFSRIRSVSIDDKGIMYCSCCKFECRGYFCADQVCVADAVHAASGTPFLGFTHNDIAPRYCAHFMYMAYKPTTPKDIQESLHQLALDDVQGPTLTVDIASSMVIQECGPCLSALDRLKNYNKNDIQLETIDGMYSTNYSPSGDQEPLDSLFQQMFTELKATITTDTEKLFQVSMSNSCLPKRASKGVTSRQKLKSVMDTAFALSDVVGHEGLEKLEETLDGFNQWCASKIETMEGNTSSGDKRTEKRTYAHMSQESYTGTAERVYNTHHM